jgi:azurin
MTMRSFVQTAVTVAAVAIAAGRLAAAPPAVRVVELQGNDLMKYSVTAIAAKPGELLHVKLKNGGTLPKAAMAHNFILLAKGTDASAFANAAATASATGYVPAQFKAKILASTPLAGPGETVEVTFKAPAVPGDYTFLCSFPGHFLSGMKGVLTVK